MKTLRVALAAALVCPQAMAAQAPALPAANSAASADAASAGSSAAPGPSGKTRRPHPRSAPLSTVPTPVPLPSYSGPSSGTLSGFPVAPMCGGPERQELDKITALNMIEQQKAASKLFTLNDERDDAAAHYNALFEKQKLELSPLEFELKRLQLESNIQDEKFKAELAAKAQERDTLHLQNDIAREKLAAGQVEADAEKLKVDIAIRDLDFQSRKLRMDAEIADHKTVALKADLDLRAKQEDWKTQTNHEPVYEADPFKDGVLTISDRRIALDGPIVEGTADDVTDRLNYFNNKDEKLPIFIVIDRSPGGSVMEGYRIVKAMRASKAPVCVVVKSYAASMAAVITTLAPRSYVYPNAVLLHHQILSFSFGNLTEQKEQLAVLKQWYERLSEPVAKKMGMTLDEFTKDMYKHNSDGNWEEFGNEAVKLKWADHVVSEIRETGVIKEPGEDEKDERPKLAFGLAEETDSHGDRFVRLPRLQPYDAYWIDNSDNYYR
ncbi:MAG TPA: ATP-dependent Clp protease proteolytic subunit [Elusimicrobiota bacterium]|nr:ATP-dependent Clp protease proteolytic subunit [Elusimicrobiota bacterium]